MRSEPRGAGQPKTQGSKTALGGTIEGKGWEPMPEAENAPPRHATFNLCRYLYVQFIRRSRWAELSTHLPAPPDQ